MSHKNHQHVEYENHSQSHGHDTFSHRGVCRFGGAEGALGGGGAVGGRGAECDNYIAIYCWQIVNGFELSHGIYLTTSESQMVELTFAIPERSH